MDKSSNVVPSDNDHYRSQPRRSPRTGATGPSAGLLAAKQHMKIQASKTGHADYLKDDYATAQDAKHLVRGQTGVVFDDRMVDHYCLWDQNYPECPARFTSVIDRCNELGLLERCVKINPREGTEKEILKKHTPDQIEKLKATQYEECQDKLEELSSKCDAVFINKASYHLSLLSVGCTIDLVDAVCKGKIQNGMAIIRPPGHHAMKSEYCGYCFFNNVALAASHALDTLGLQRILIVDWDVHHGQATQQMFYDDPRVVYFSLHRYEHGSFWPELRESDYHYVGQGGGRGYNFNVPLNKTGMKDADYLAAFQQILMPMAYEFGPQLVIVSAGYDAAIGCPEYCPDLVLISAGFDSALGDEKGEMEVSPACYAHLTNMLMGLAEGKVAVVLEGGYCLKSLSDGAALTLRCLLGDAAPSLVDFGTPCDSMCESIYNVIYTHRSYWHCFQLQDVYTPDGDSNMKTRKRSMESNTVLEPAERHYPTVKYLGNETKPDSYLTRNCYPLQSEEFLRDVNQRLDALRLTKLPCTPHRVALVYDHKMQEHRNLTEADHPEKPERTAGVLSRHEEFGLFDRCYKVQPREASEEELLLVHTEKHVLDMRDTRGLSIDELVSKGDAFDSIYLHPKSYECALLAAGSVLQVVDTVVNEEARSGVAIVRPPGHHAEEDAACGFCLFNNVSLAAKYAVEVHGLSRVLVLDWDVHHGNGSQRMFEADPRVLYISLHRYNNGRFFPSSTDADFDKVGTGPGTGFNINIPWNKNGGGLSDGDYIAAFHSVVLPVAYQFNPQLVLVSAGFDACVNDPLGHCKVTPEAFGHMTHWLTGLANGKVILSLEGGYNVTSVSYALTLCTKALLGDPLPALATSPNTPCSSAVDTIKNVLRTHEKYWTCLRFNKALPKEKRDMTDGRSFNKQEKEELKDKMSGLGLQELQAKLSELELQDSDIAPGSGGGGGGGNPWRQGQDGGAGAAGGTGPPRQTLTEYLSDNMEQLLNQEMFAVIPLPGCPHLPEMQPVPAQGIDVHLPCQTCSLTQENWVCLTCYAVQCGRYVGEHMLQHHQETSHSLALSFSDLSVWCYPCEAYIDNMILYDAKNAVHRSKFGSDLAWSYGVRQES